MIPNKLVLFPGTFDPPTVGHIQAAESIVKLEGNVYWMPGGKTPHKNPSTTPEQRLEMVELTISKLSNHKVLTLELDKDSSWFSIDTVKLIKSLNPNCEIIWYLGSDSYQSLPSWNGWEELKGLVTFKEIQRGLNDPSSTQIRLDLENNKHLLDPDVYRYIKERDLYAQTSNHNTPRPQDEPRERDSSGCSCITDCCS